MSALCHKRTHALQQFCLTWSAWPSVAKGECLCAFQEGFLIDKNFKIDAVQQLQIVVCFNFSLFHLCHTLVNSSSRSRDQIEQIL
jgi:hypothetical protein